MVIISSITNNNNNGVNRKKPTKTTKGRQKIEIKKLEDKNSLQVTFSKRRTGLFNKAMELSVLCGAEVGVLVFSPNGKVFVIGHPDFDTVLNCYLNGESPPSSPPPPPPPPEAAAVQEHNKELGEGVRELEKEKEKRRGKEAIEAEEKKVIKRHNDGGGFWWDESNIDEMGLEELEEYVKGLQKLRTTVASRINQMMTPRTTTTTTMSSQYNLDVPPAAPAAATMAATTSTHGGLLPNFVVNDDGGSACDCGCDGFVHRQFPQHFRI